MDLNKLLHQFARFLCVSGIGFIIDFSLFYFFTGELDIYVAYANVLSSIPAISWVFFVSTKNVFCKNCSKIPIWVKYTVYFIYQMILLFVVSWLAHLLYQLLLAKCPDMLRVHNNLQLLCKCLITPVTMISNFIVLKNIAERF